jgi:hypothetical protein
MSNRTWISEHGKDYAVPEAVLKLFRDCSWHNEMCPRFAVGSVDEDKLTLWVDHPVAEEREVSGGRYLVCKATGILKGDGPDLTVYEGDNMQKAITTALEIARYEFKEALSPAQYYYLSVGELLLEAKNQPEPMTENERLLMGALRKLRLEIIHYRETGYDVRHLDKALKESEELLMKVCKNQGPEALLGELITKNDPRIDRGRP